MISIKSLVLSLDVIHSAKYLFPSVLSVLVLHLLSKIKSRSNSFISLTKFIISSPNYSLFIYSLFKNFPPFLFQNSHLFIDEVTVTLISITASPIYIFLLDHGTCFAYRGIRLYPCFTFQLFSISNIN